MEHIVQFAIGIDDDAIVKRIKESAEISITKDLRNKVGRIMFGCNSWRGDEADAITEWTEGLFMRYLEDHKAEIIELTTKCLADKLMKTKAVREATQDVLKQVADT